MPLTFFDNFEDIYVIPEPYSIEIGGALFVKESMPKALCDYPLFLGHLIRIQRHGVGGGG